MQLDVQEIVQLQRVQSLYIRYKKKSMINWTAHILRFI